MSPSVVVRSHAHERDTPESRKPPVRFRYGRHETFAVRHGWLTKAVRRIEEANGDLTPNLDTADALGLGSKMVQSLQFWTEATGLVEAREPVTLSRNVRGGTSYKLSPLGRTIVEHDPFMEYPATWWFLHMELCSAEGTVWSWFFNAFDERHFDRNACTDAYLRHTQEKAVNPATPGTAQKDVACLLAAYASTATTLNADDRTVPGARSASSEEEGVAASPLRDLGLIVRHDVVNRYERVRAPDRIPAEVFLACASRLAARADSEAISLANLACLANSPGRVLCLGSGLLERAVDEAVETYSHRGVRSELLGAELHLVVPYLEAETWLKLHFDRIGVRRS